MKKHFILLGKQGLIYYSWLFVILCIGLTIGYEGVAKINWPAIIIIAIFGIIFIYSLFFSYYDANILKLPYRSKLKLTNKPKMVWAWKKLIIQSFKIDELETIYLLTIKKSDDTHKM